MTLLINTAIYNFSPPKGCAMTTDQSLAFSSAVYHFILWQALEYLRYRHGECYCVRGDNGIHW